MSKNILQFCPKSTCKKQVCFNYNFKKRLNEYIVLDYVDKKVVKTKFEDGIGNDDVIYYNFYPKKGIFVLADQSMADGSLTCTAYSFKDGKKKKLDTYGFTLDKNYSRIYNWNGKKVSENTYTANDTELCGTEDGIRFEYYEDEGTYYTRKEILKKLK